MNIHFLTVFLYKTTDRKINKYPFTLAFSLGLEYDCNLTKRKQENRNWRGFYGSRKQWYRGFPVILILQ